MTKKSKKHTFGSYELSQFNAIKHGVLSKHTLLPWESRKQYDRIHVSLRKEYAPVGLTEAHLVEEIAGIIWRKRRLRMAETAAFQSKMSTLRDANDPVESDDRVPWEFPNIDDQVWALTFNMNSEDWASNINGPRMDRQYTQALLKILDAGGSQAFEWVLETLPPDFREDWEQQVAEGKYSSTPKDFRNYIVQTDNLIKKIIDKLYKMSSDMARAHGVIFNPELLEKLSRYEVFLDRKLEKILSMLLKLQARRREREQTLE